MFRLPLILLTTLLLVVGGPSETLSDPPPFSSVRPLQVRVDGDIVGICTVFSVGHRQWLTSTHCILKGPAGPRYINGDPVTPVAENDGAILLTTLRSHLPPLYISRDHLKAGDPVTIISYPLLFEDPLLTSGVISHPSAIVPMIRERGKRLLVNVAGGPGSSGAPILNGKGDVIGVVEGGWIAGGFSPVMAATQRDSLLRLMETIR